MTLERLRTYARIYLRIHHDPNPTGEDRLLYQVIGRMLLAEAPAFLPPSGETTPPDGAEP